MYDPTIGEFITEDPIGFEAGDANLRRYVGNSPTNGTDPSGMVERAYQVLLAYRIPAPVSWSKALLLDVCQQPRPTVPNVREVVWLAYPIKRYISVGRSKVPYVLGPEPSVHIGETVELRQELGNETVATEVLRKALKWAEWCEGITATNEEEGYSQMRLYIDLAKSQQETPWDRLNRLGKEEGGRANPVVRIMELFTRNAERLKYGPPPDDSGPAFHSDTYVKPIPGTVLLDEKIRRPTDAAVARFFFAIVASSFRPLNRDTPSVTADSFSTMSTERWRNIYGAGKDRQDYERGKRNQPIALPSAERAKALQTDSATLVAAAAQAGAEGLDEVLNGFKEAHLVITRKDNTVYVYMRDNRGIMGYMSSQKPEGYDMGAQMVLAEWLGYTRPMKAVPGYEARRN